MVRIRIFEKGQLGGDFTPTVVVKSSFSKMYIGGSRGARPPYGSRFFHFDMQNFRNVAASGVHGSAYEVHAPPLREILDPPLMYVNFLQSYTITCVSISTSNI